MVTSQGYTTAGGQTRKFPAILGEFGSFMNNSQDSCFSNGCIAGEGAVRGRRTQRLHRLPGDHVLASHHADVRKQTAHTLRSAQRRRCGASETTSATRPAASTGSTCRWRAGSGGAGMPILVTPAAWCVILFSVKTYKIHRVTVHTNISTVLPNAAFVSVGGLLCSQQQLSSRDLPQRKDGFCRWAMTGTPSSGRR